MEIPFPPEEVRAVVFDFDGLAAFMPNVDSSRVISRSPGQTLVRQVGGVRFLVSRTVRMNVLFRGVDEDTVAFEETSGSFDEYRGTWSVSAAGGGSRVAYHAVIRQSFHLPGPLVRHLVSRSAERMMPAIADEARRRHVRGDAH